MMRLNSKGFAPKALVIAVGVALLACLLHLWGTNDYADIPETQAIQTAKSDHEHFTIKKGEMVKILGAEFVMPNKPKKGEGKTIMLLVQTAKGERDLVSKDIVSEEMFEQILPELKKHTYTSGGMFSRKTMTKAAWDSIPLGLSIEAMDSLLYPTKTAYMEKGVLKADYSRMQIFDKSTGTFSSPYVHFKNGKYVSSELREQNTHWNAWLLRFLPGANWVYGHNILNNAFFKKSFKWSRLKDKPTFIMGSGILETIFAIVVLVLFLVVVFGFHVFIPMLPVYTFYGLLTFPPIFKVFNRTLTDICLIALTVLSYYYVWLTYMPYMSFFLMPILMVPAAMYALRPLLDFDETCPSCKYMNTSVFDHKELVKEYDTERNESHTSKIGSRITGRRQTWEQETVTTKSAYSGRIISQYTNKKNVKNLTDYEDTYQTKNYHKKYHVRLYIDYYKCEVCGAMHTYYREDYELLSSDYLGSSTHTTTKTV